MKFKPEHLAAVAFVLTSATGILSQTSQAVATISVFQKPPAKVHTVVFVINYSDLITQLALQPNSPLDPPRAEDLTSAINLVIDQRLLRHAGESDPQIRNSRPTPSENQRMVAEMASVFPSRTEFEYRLAKANLGSSDFPRFQILLRHRWLMQKYIDKHFRRLVSLIPEGTEKCYEDVFDPGLQDDLARLRREARIVILKRF